MIPLRLAPLPWEQLGGYYVRAAELLSCRVRDLMAEANEPPRKAFDLAGLSAFPQAATVAATQRAFGLSAEAVNAMTLRRFRTDLFGRADVPITAGAESEAPVLLGGGLYCLRCVKEGLWDLRWKTALSSVCLRHGIYLRARCPSCARVFAPDTLSPPDEARPDAFLHGGRGCTAALAGPSVHAADPHLGSQWQLFETLERAQTDPAAAATCRDVLRWAEYLHRSLSDRTFIAGSMVALAGPALSDLLQASLELAVRREAGGDVHPALRRAIDTQRARGRPPGRAPKVKSLGVV